MTAVAARAVGRRAGTGQAAAAYDADDLEIPSFLRRK